MLLFSDFIVWFEGLKVFWFFSTDQIFNWKIPESIFLFLYSYILYFTLHIVVRGLPLYFVIPFVNYKGTVTECEPEPRMQEKTWVNELVTTWDLQQDCWTTTRPSGSIGDRQWRSSHRWKQPATFYKMN